MCPPEPYLPTVGRVRPLQGRRGVVGCHLTTVEAGLASGRSNVEKCPELCGCVNGNEMIMVVMVYMVCVYIYIYILYVYTILILGNSGNGIIWGKFIMNGWWCNKHLEKCEFVNGKDDNPYIMGKKCLKPPTRL